MVKTDTFTFQDLEEAGIKVPDGKIGKKKLEKLQAKADKKLQVRPEYWPLIGQNKS